MDSVPLNLNTRQSENGSLRQLRQNLLDQPDLQGISFCRAYSQVTDSWLAELFAQATSSDSEKMALLAVGGYGRQELCPGSDLDLLLVYRTKIKHLKKIADAIWYPIWDQSIHLDHSVRDLKQVVIMAKEDLKVLLGLIDARYIAGNRQLAQDVVDKSKQLWSSNVSNSISQLTDLVASRHHLRGEVAYLLEPDIKEDRGGLRDLHAISCVARAIEDIAQVTSQPELAQANEHLLRVRVELQRRSSKETNQLILQEQEPIAGSLGLDGADELMYQTASAARKISWNYDKAFQIVQRKVASGPKPVAPIQLALHLSLTDGEIWIADQDIDCALALRACVLAAESGNPISFQSLQLLADRVEPPPTPWPEHLRQLFVSLLGMGPPAISEIESLDQVGIFEKLVQEWRYVRHKPQRNAFHRFTVDRHLCEAAAEAASFVRSVSRPDLLLVGALLHDIGKGFPGDHTQVGIEVVDRIARRMGFDAHDRKTLSSMVRFHLLLPDTAAKRDLDDPKTIETVANSVRDPELLLLLAHLAKADSIATGPSMSSPWRLRMIDDLVARVHRLLVGEQIPLEVAENQTPQEISELIRRVESEVKVAISHQILADEDGWELTIVARDQVGLLARVAGVLSLNGLIVRQAQVAQAAPGIARETFEVEPRFDRVPNWDKLESDLKDAIEGISDLQNLIKLKELEYSRSKRAGAALTAEPKVLFDNEASHRATIVEVRAPDGIGVLYKIASALSEAGLDIISAKVQTLGHEVVDNFYVTKAQESENLKVLGQQDLIETQRSILERLSS